MNAIFAGDQEACNLFENQATQSPKYLTVFVTEFGADET
jgi:hypothetical protein